MGYEYTIKFEIGDASEVSELLTSLPYFQHVHPFENRHQFIYRMPENEGQARDALARLE